LVSDRSGQLEQNFHPNDSDDPLGTAHSKVSLNSMCILSVNGSNTKIHSVIRKVTELLSQNDALGKFHSIGGSQTGGGPKLHFGPFSKKLKSNSKNQKKNMLRSHFLRTHERSCALPHQKIICTTERGKNSADYFIHIVRQSGFRTI